MPATYPCLPLVSHAAHEFRAATSTFRTGAFLLALDAPLLKELALALEEDVSSSFLEDSLRVLAELLVSFEGITLPASDAEELLSHFGMCVSLIRLQRLGLVDLVDAPGLSILGTDEPIGKASDLALCAFGQAANSGEVIH